MQSAWMQGFWPETNSLSSHKIFKPCLITLFFACSFTLFILPYWGKAIIPVRFACGLLAVCLLCLSTQLRSGLFRSPAFYAMLAYAAACGASTLVNGLRFSLAGTGFAWLCVFLAFWCLGSALREQARLPFVLLGLAVISMLCGYIILGTEGLGLIQESAWQSMGDRLVGTFKSQGNRLAVLLAASAFLCLSGGFTAKDKKLRIALWALAVLLFFFLINSGTRTWTGLFFGTALVYLFTQKVSWRVIAGAGVIISLVFGLLYLMDASQLENFKAVEGGRRSLLSRLSMWQLAWDLFTQTPLLGVGPEQFREFYEQHYAANLAHLFLAESRFAIAKTTHAHNIILSPLAETGLAGALSLCAALFVSVLSGLKRPGLCRDAAIFLILLFVVGMLNPALGREPGTVLAAMIGLAAARPCPSWIISRPVREL